MVARKLAKTIDQLTKHEKLAIIILALGEDEGAQVLKRLPQYEALKVAHLMSRLGHVDMELANQVLVEFKNSFTKSPGLSGGSEITDRIINQTFSGEKKQRFQKELKANSLTLDAIEGVDSDTLAMAIQNEQPQILATVLSFASPDVSARVLQRLPQSIHNEVLTRIAKLGPISPMALEALNEELSDKIKKTEALSMSHKGGAKQVAKILAELDTSQHQTILDDIESRDPKLAEEIREQIFTFEDITKISLRDMQKVHSAVGDAWKIALRGAADEIQQHVFASVSKRAASLLRDDIESGTPKALSEVKDKRKWIVQQILELQKCGEISLNDKDVYV